MGIEGWLAEVDTIFPTLSYSITYNRSLYCWLCHGDLHFSVLKRLISFVTRHLCGYWVEQAQQLSLGF